MAIQEAAVEMVNREQPDVVLMTGDYVCHSQDYLDALTDPRVEFGQYPFDFPTLWTLRPADVPQITPGGMFIARSSTPLRQFTAGLGSSTASGA